MDKGNTKKLRQVLFPMMFLILFIIAWEMFASSGILDEVIFPKFTDVIISVIENYSELQRNFMVTFTESILAFALGSVIGFVFAVLFSLSKNIKTSLMPFAIALKATPLIALAPLIILWLGNGIESKIFMGAVFLLFTVLINTTEGLESAAKEQLDLFRSYGASNLQILLKLRIPNAMPFVFSALKISSTLAVVGVIIGEFTGSTEGLGYVMLNSSYYLDTPLLFACILLISLWGVAFYCMVLLAEYLLIKKRYLMKYL